MTKRNKTVLAGARGGNMADGAARLRPARGHDGVPGAAVKSHRRGVAAPGLCGPLARF